MVVIVAEILVIIAAEIEGMEFTLLRVLTRK